MASTTSTIRIIFDGAVEGLRRAARAAERDLDRINGALERNKEHIDTFDKTSDRISGTVATMTKAFLGLGAASSTIQSVVAVAGTLASITAQLAPAALALPGIFLGVAAAAGTLKIGLLGVGDALKGDAKALASLSPEAKTFVTSVRSMSTEWDKLRKTTQDALFKGLGAEVKATGSQLLALATGALPRIATGFNQMAAAGLRAARTPLFQKQLSKIFDDTSVAVGNMRDSLANAVSGLVGLGTAGSRFLPAIGRAIDDIARKFNDWVQKGLLDGSINRAIDRALQGFRDLGAVFANVFRAGASAFEAFNRGLNGGGGTIASLKAASVELLNFVNQPAVQDGLRALGETVRVLSDTFRTVLAAALRELGPLLRDIAPFVQEVARQIGFALVAAINTVGPLLQGLARFLSDNKDQIAPLVPLLIPLAVGFKAVALAIAAIKGLAALTAAFTALRLALAGGLAARLTAVALAIGRFLWPIAAFAGLALFAKYIDEINIAAAGGDPEKLDGMAATLHNLVAAGEALAKGDLPAIFADIGAEWDQLKAKFNTGPEQSPIGKFKDGLVTDLAEILLDLTTFGTDVQTFFTVTLPGYFTSAPLAIDQWFTDTFVTPAETGFETFKTAISTKLAEASLTIANFFRNPAGTGFDIGAAVGQMIIDFLNGFTTLATQTKAKLDETTAAIRNWATVQVPAAVAGLAARLILTAVQAWQGFLASTTQKLAEIVAFVTQLPARIGAALAGLVGTLIKVALDAWNSFFGQTKSGGDRSVSETRTVPGKMGSALSALPGILLRAATDAFNGFIRGCQDGISRAVAVVRTLPGLAASAAGNLGGTLVAAGASLIQGFINGINSKIAGIRAAAAAAAAAARAFFPFSPAKEGPFSGRGYTTFSGQALVVDFADAIRRATPAAAAAAAALTRATSGALTPAIQLGAFEAAQLARVQSQAASRSLLGTAVNQVTAVATREPATPVTNVTVLLSREQIAEIARVVVEDSQRETARRVTAGPGITF